MHQTKAAVYYGPGNISVEKRSLHRVGAAAQEPITLRVKSCCVCGYDARVFRHGHRKVTAPVVLGHEICAETINDVGSIKAGTRVAIYPVLPCLQCKHCKDKKYNLCIDAKEIGSSIDGGFSEYLVVPQVISKIGGLVPIPDGIRDEEAALIEPLACCVNSLFRSKPGLNSNNNVLIVGDGPMGVLHYQLVSKLLSPKTVLIGKVGARMDFARSIGADVFSSQDKFSDIMEPTNGNGYDLVIVATSNPSALSLSCKLVTKGGRINIFAGMQGDSTLDPNVSHYNEITISGSFSSTPANFRYAVDLVSSGVVELRRLVTHNFSLDDVSRAIDATENYLGMRAAVTP